MLVCMSPWNFSTDYKNAFNRGRRQINVVESAMFNGCVTVKV